MIETTLTKQQMDSAKALSETNIQISEAKNILFNLQEEETTYLISREKKVMDRIEGLYQTSKSTLDEIQNNYTGVTETLRMVTEATSFLSESHAKFQALLKEFETRNEAWNKESEEQEKKWEDLKKGIDIEKTTIENDKKSLERAKVVLAEERRKIEDERGTLLRAVERLKQNRI